MIDETTMKMKRIPAPSTKLQNCGDNIYIAEEESVYKEKDLSDKNYRN